MKKIILFLLFTAVFFPSINFGCTCASPGSFCGSIINSEGNVLANLLVLRAKTIGRSPTGMEVEISESIYGESINQSKINIRQSFCTLYMNELEEKEEYVFALKKRDDNFYALDCGIFFLKIKNNVVTGNIVPGINSIAYEQLGDLESCGSVFDLFAVEKNILVYPSPTSGEIKIKNSNANQLLGDLELRVFDVTGRLLLVRKKEAGILPEEIWELDMQTLAAGLYILQLSNNNSKKSFRIVKQ